MDQARSLYQSRGLPADRGFLPYWLADGQRPAQAMTALLDCVERSLIAYYDQIELASLGLRELESTLGRLLDIFAFYAAFGDLPAGLESLTSLSLQDNPISGRSWPLAWLEEYS